MTDVKHRNEEFAAAVLLAAIFRDRGMEPEPWRNVPESIKETTRGFVRIVVDALGDGNDD